MTTRLRFHEGLDELKQKLLAMAGLAEQAVDRASRAYRARDLKICEAVLASEKAINAAERAIDELALDLLAMQQPMAVDLRFILAVIKINADLERIGDQAVNIVERVRDMHQLPAADLPADIPRLASTTAEMIRRALEAFLAADAGLANQVLEMDDLVDRQTDDVFAAMEKIMAESPQRARQALNTLLVARNFERVADHATNIAEDVIFWVRGADVRHQLGDQTAKEAG